MLVLNIAITLLVCKVQIILCLWMTTQTHVSHITNIFLIQTEKKSCLPLPPNHQRGQRTSKYPTTFKIDCPLLSLLSLSKKSKKIAQISLFHSERFLCFSSLPLANPNLPLQLTLSFLFFSLSSFTHRRPIKFVQCITIRFAQPLTHRSSMLGQSGSKTTPWSATVGILGSWVLDYRVCGFPIRFFFFGWCFWFFFAWVFSRRLRRDDCEAEMREWSD